MQTNIPGIYAAGDVAAATTSDGREHRYLGMERHDDLLQALQLWLFPAALNKLY